jgi:serine/threonine-protein kinase HipA
MDLAQIAAESFAILEDDNYAGKHISELVQRGGSPGGARPKIFLKQGDDEWLIKFRAKNDKKSVGREEYRYSLLAKQCGIEMPETKLFEDQWFGVKRFDRVNGHKLHVVSASGLLQADYQIPSIDYMHLFTISARLSHSMEELWKIYRLMCFNVLIGNRDDHAKNFAFIFDKGWRFAPAYDLLPCGAIGDYHTTSVNDNPLPERADVLLLAEKVGLDSKQATAIFDEMKIVLGRR